MGKTVTRHGGVVDVVEQSPENVQRLVAALRELVKDAAPEAEERLQKSSIDYYRDGLFCYIWPLKRRVTFGFHNGAGLPDPKGLLAGEGKARHLKLNTVEEIPRQALAKLVAAAYRQQLS